MKDFYEGYELKGLSAQLFQAFIHTADLREFISRAGRILGHPMHVLDNHYRIQASCLLDTLGDIYWEDTTDLGYYNNPEMLLTANKRFLIPGSSLPREVFRLTLNGNPYGWIVLLCQGSLSKEVKECLPLLRDLTIKLSGLDRRSINLNRQRFHDSIFEDLLTGKIRTYSALRNHLGLAGLTEHPAEFQLITIPLPNHLGQEESLQLQDKIESLFPGSPGILHQMTLLILRYISCTSVPEEEREKERALKFLLEKEELFACLSDKFTDLLTIPDHYEKNLYSLRLAKQIKESKTLLFYEDYKFLNLCLRGVNYNARKLDTYASEKVLQIRRYDALHGTDYFATLQAFLRSGRSPAQAAKNLFVHKNTISYRIAKLKELFDLDLQSMESIFTLSYSCFLLHFQDIAAAEH